MQTNQITTNAAREVGQLISSFGFPAGTTTEEALTSLRSELVASSDPAAIKAQIKALETTTNASAATTAPQWDSEHTAGPWVVRGTYIETKDRVCIAETYNAGGYHRPANARLIAAAPDLKAALQRISDDIEGVIQVAAMDGQKERIPSLRSIQNSALEALKLI